MYCGGRAPRRFSARGQRQNFLLRDVAAGLAAHSGGRMPPVTRYRCGHNARRGGDLPCGRRRRRAGEVLPCTVTTAPPSSVTVSGQPIGQPMQDPVHVFHRPALLQRYRHGVTRAAQSSAFSRTSLHLTGGQHGPLAAVDFDPYRGTPRFLFLYTPPTRNRSVTVSPRSQGRMR